MKKICGLQAYYRIIITDKTGKVVWKSNKRKSKSFVKQWLQLIEALFAHINGVAAATVTIKDTSNSNESVAANGTNLSWNNLSLLGPAAQILYGIVVGTGTNAPASTDIALQTIIGNGTGEGQLTYGAQTYTPATIVGANIDLVFTRAMTNGSGGSITANEIGFYLNNVNTAGTQKYFCIIRDKLETPITVDDTKTLTIQYTLETTV